jgi:hypothetical protein
MIFLVSLLAVVFVVFFCFVVARRLAAAMYVIYRS